MSPRTIGVSRTYKTRVALKVIVSNAKEPFLDKVKDRRVSSFLISFVAWHIAAVQQDKTTPI